MADLPPPSALVVPVLGEKPAAAAEELSGDAGSAEEGSGEGSRPEEARPDCSCGPNCKWKSEVYDERTIALLQSCVRRWRCKKDFAQLVLLALHHPSLAPFRKRNEVWRELLTTERAYVTSLTFLEQYWLIPLRKDNEEAAADHSFLKKKPILETKEIDLLFGGIVQMRDFHVELLKHMESAARRWPAWNGLGDLLASQFPFLRLYIKYVQDFDEKTRFLIARSKSTSGTGKRWHKFEDRVMKEEASAGMDLRAFLIMPIQRVPRYELLLRELIKLTPEDHVDRKNLEKAAQLVHDIAAQINERQSDPEIQRAMQQVLDRTYEMKGTLADRMTVRFGKKRERTAITGPMSKSKQNLLLSSAKNS